MAVTNFFDVRGSMGAAEQDAQAKEMNQLKIDAGKQGMANERELQAARWLYAYSEAGMRQPDLIPQIVKEGVQKGFLPPEVGSKIGQNMMGGNFEAMVPELQKINQSAAAAIQQYGGGQGKELPNEAREYEYFQRLSTEQKKEYLARKRSQPGLKLEAIPNADGSKKMVLLDEATGQGYDFGSGKPITPGPQGYQPPGQPATPQAATTAPDPGFGVQQSPAAAKEAEMRTEERVTKELDAPRVIQAAQREIQSIDRTVDQIGDVLGVIDWGNTGNRAQLLAKVGGTDAKALQAKLKPILASMAFGRLQAMREASKTGGALGQVSERELDLLQNSIAAVDQATGKEDLTDALLQVNKHYQQARQYQVGIQAMASGIPFVATPAEAKKLPPGSSFVTPDGRVLRVPDAAN